MSRYARYDRSPKGRARKARYRATGRENTLRWLRKLRAGIERKEALIAHLTEVLNHG
jgi:hypothetical protein